MARALHFGGQAFQPVILMVSHLERWLSPVAELRPVGVLVNGGELAALQRGHHLRRRLRARQRVLGAARIHGVWLRCALQVDLEQVCELGVEGCGVEECRVVRPSVVPLCPSSEAELLRRTGKALAGKKPGVFALEKGQMSLR